MLNIWAHNLKMTKIGVRSNTYNIVVSTSNSNTESQIIDRGGREGCGGTITKLSNQ